MTFLLGLTGSIGMGKSTTSAMFRACGVPLHDADAAVHGLYRGRAVAPIAAVFPGVVRDGAIDRATLSAAVLGKPEALHALEAIIHPLVREEEQTFLADCRLAGAALAVLDVPLLLETGGETRCDAVLVVTAPAAVQRERVLARPEMTVEKFEAILARQMPDAEKRRRAHFLVDSGGGLMAARRQVGSILSALAGRPGRQQSSESAAHA
ncbi:dephospho-CoA kinase [Bosea sp. PAMC 26642]|uniref:dephospho-CoA kinase n=1 Tax=Bosea sp. (strain PAMC 26642) TaxID=1792307 RepID=UPI0007704C12|nr:dephospho-CoA kinase [Bosea sp. PAMC 26642]AMJ62166.1 dephospho-CoA kinase [Bosea sp. PAMC 26642]